MVEVVRSAVNGFLMGAADLVPGVSGGTMALVVGIYERLVASIREGSSALGSLMKADMSGFKDHLGQVEWRFLISLLVGILGAIISLAHLLEHQLEVNPTVMAGGFFGLVIGSVVIAWQLIRSPRPVHLLVLVVVGLAVFLVLGLGEDVTVADPPLLAFLGAGALAICAMILPGISGSLLLLLMGMYASVLGAVNDRDLVALGIFVIGAIVGLAVFSQVLYWALKHHHDVVLAGLIGLMAGSLRVLWPWPNGVDSSELAAPGDDLGAVVVAAVVGLAFVYIVSRLALARTSTEPQPTV